MSGQQRFRVEAAGPRPGETEPLVGWTLRNLRACEEWLVRRRLLAPAGDLLPGLRARSAAGVGPVATAARATAPRQAVHEEAVLAVASKLEDDLGRHYADSLAEGRIGQLTVVPVDGTLTPLYDVRSGDLFVPRWHLARVLDDSLFTASELFPHPVRATSSWLFFQSLVLDATPVGTAAHHLRIRESQ